MQEIKEIPSFLQKLYDILESDQQAIRWNQDNTKFLIMDQSLLTEQIMPQYFKHRNYQSFLRQLNMYGFKTLKNSQGKSEFQHSQFKGDLKKNLLKIKRRNQVEVKQSIENLTKEFQQESYLNEHEKLREQLLELQLNQRSLLKEIRVQIEHNQSLRRETQDISDRINTVKSYQLTKLNKLIIIIQKLPEDAQISKMALIKEKILRKLEIIEAENSCMQLEKQDSFMFQQPNLTGVKSPAGYSLKVK